MTRIAAFSPLLFWPGIVGEFMKYMPITLIATLSASMLYALIFVPTLGSIISKPFKNPPVHKDGGYMWVVGKAIRHPFIVMFLTLGTLVAVPYTYMQIGKGVEFFPNVEPDFGQLYVKARGNLSIQEKDVLVRQAETRLLGWPGLETVYTRVGSGGGDNAASDVIGTIQYEFVDWRKRKNAIAILADLRVAMQGIPGVEIEVSVPEAGPPTGKAIQIRLSADDPAGLKGAARLISGKLADIADVTDINEGLPLPGVDWELKVNRGEASRYGASPGAVGAVVQLVTSGLKLSDFRPAGSDDAVDIVLRLPPDQRTISALDQLRIETELGPVPISNFVTRVAAPTSGTLTRIDGARSVTVEAGIKEGVQAQDVRDKVTVMLNETFKTEGFTDAGIRWTMVGEDQEQAEAGAFLSKAFGAAIFLIFVVLLAQFNKFISVGLVLSAVIMSTIGVFLGLMIMGQPFGIVMSGIGVIALAGVVVNNNIVLIATFDQLRDAGMGKIDAILETCRERARPVVLTALTAIFGVLPIAFGLNLELLNHETTFGAPSTQWWISLSSAIVFGLAFATILTLIVTPSMLMLVTRGDKDRTKGRGWFRRKPSGGLVRKSSKLGQPAE